MLQLIKAPFGIVFRRVKSDLKNLKANFDVWYKKSKSLLSESVPPIANFEK